MPAATGTPTDQEDPVIVTTAPITTADDDGHGPFADAADVEGVHVTARAAR